MRFVWVVALLLVTVASLACPKAPPSNQQAAPKAAAGTPARSSDSRVAAIQDRIEKLGPEAKSVLDNVKARKLTVGGLKSDKTLGEIADYLVKKANDAGVGMEGIGWDAFKNPDGSWFVYYHFKDGQGSLTLAKWHYDVKKDSVEPMEQHASEFSYVAPEKK